MRHDRLYLIDILESARDIEEFIEDTDESTFVSNKLLRSAVLQKLTIIGEAVARLSSESKSRHSHIEWADIVGFRNVVVHAYFSIDWSIIWATATESVPKLADDVRQIVSDEYES